MTRHQYSWTTHLAPILHGVALVEGLGSAKMPSWLGILRVWSLQDPEEEGTSGVDAKSTRNVRVEAGGTQVAGHVGLHALGSFADRLGLGETLSAAVGWTGRGTPVHDRSKVLTQAMLMLAGGRRFVCRHRDVGVPGATVW